MAAEDWISGEEADERYDERNRMASVDVEVDEIEVTANSGRIVDGVRVTCGRCSHSVEVCGRTEASVKRGCAMLRDECPNGERNFYVGEAPDAKAATWKTVAKPTTATATTTRLLAHAVQYEGAVARVIEERAKVRERLRSASVPIQEPEPTPPAWLSGDQPMYLFFDTTGIPAGADSVHMVQIAWLLVDDNEETRADGCFIIKPEGFVIPNEVAKIHGITQGRANTEGRPLDNVMCLFTAMCYFPIRIVGHNINFDLKIVRKEYERLGWPDSTFGHETLCTMAAGTDLCAIERRGGGYKFPKLNELYRKLFNEDFENAHDARADIAATARCFWELRRMGRI
jgi:DNA polymerase-3 subunit epsilon